jgi:hypothetical protein
MADYVPHDEAEALAAGLIEKHHPHLKGLKIAHLLRIMPVPKKQKNPKPVRQGRKIVLAKTSKVSSKMAALASADFKFVIEYGSLYWMQMDDKFKLALVDHELGHCGNDGDGVYLKNHDIEDFGFMLERHGAWKKDVEQFVTTVLQNFALGGTPEAQAALDASVDAEVMANLAEVLTDPGVDLAGAAEETPLTTSCFTGDECDAEGAFSV